MTLFSTQTLYLLLSTEVYVNNLFIALSYRLQHTKAQIKKYKMSFMKHDVLTVRSPKKTKKNVHNHAPFLKSAYVIHNSKFVLIHARQPCLFNERRQCQRKLERLATFQLPGYPVYAQSKTVQ